jgi:hypothetical protein
MASAGFGVICEFCCQLSSCVGYVRTHVLLVGRFGWNLGYKKKKKEKEKRQEKRKGRAAGCMRGGAACRVCIRRTVRLFLPLRKAAPRSRRPQQQGHRTAEPSAAQSRVGGDGHCTPTYAPLTSSRDREPPLSLLSREGLSALSTLNSASQAAG